MTYLLTDDPQAHAHAWRRHLEDASAGAGACAWPGSMKNMAGLGIPKGEKGSFHLLHGAVPLEGHHMSLSLSLHA